MVIGCRGGQLKIYHNVYAANVKTFVWMNKNVSFEHCRKYLKRYSFEEMTFVNLINAS